MRAQKIESGTYKIGSLVAFQRQSRDWLLGEPINWNYPVSGGQKAGTVTINSTLRDCVRMANYYRRMARKAQ